MLHRSSTVLPQFKILGQPVHLAADYTGWLIDRLQQGIGTHVVTMNAEIVMQANHNSELASIIDKAGWLPRRCRNYMALKLHGSSKLVVQELIWVKIYSN